MSQRRRKNRETRPAPGTPAPDASEAAPRHGRPTPFVEAAKEYFSGGLGFRANMILGSIALTGLLIFVLTALNGPISDDDDAGPGPTVFATPEA